MQTNKYRTPAFFLLLIHGAACGVHGGALRRRGRGRRQRGASEPALSSPGSWPLGRSRGNRAGRGRCRLCYARKISLCLPPARILPTRFPFSRLGELFAGRRAAEAHARRRTSQVCDISAGQLISALSPLYAKGSVDRAPPHAYLRGGPREEPSARATATWRATRAVSLRRVVSEGL